MVSGISSERKIKNNRNKYYSCDNCYWQDRLCGGSYGSRKILCDSFLPVEGLSGKFVPVDYSAGSDMKRMSKWMRAYCDEWLKDWTKYVGYAEGEMSGVGEL